MIALGTLALLEHPDQFAALRDTEDPALVAIAVGSTSCCATSPSPHSGRRRIALEDIEVGGRTIRAGDGIVVAGDAANRDPAAFRDPDRLDVHRDARGHVAFGFGVHACLGRQLAGAELQVVYATLYRRVPGLRLAVAVDEIPFKDDSPSTGCCAAHRAS